MGIVCKRAIWARFVVTSCFIASSLLLNATSVFAQTGEATSNAGDESSAKISLPSLMTLGQSLALANSAHPSLLKARAQSMLSKLSIDNANIASAWQANLNLEAASAELVNNDAGFKNDSRASISVSKLLWDSGRQHANKDAATLGGEVAKIAEDYANRLQRIDIMQRFFAVIAADYQFLADNEAMTLSFFPFNRAQERQERFQSVSDIDVMEKRANYFAQLTKRNQTRQKQRQSRYALALAMGLPSAQPDALVAPDLSAYQRELPDFDALLAQILAASPLLKQQQASLAQLQAQKVVAAAANKPNLRLKLTASAYEQDFRSRDKAKAALLLNVPLLAGKQQSLDLAKLDAQVAAMQAQSMALEYQISQQVLSWVQRLEMLEQILSQQSQDLEFRERALDKSRLLYEMEASARIGQAQSDMAKLIWQNVEAKFEQALIWEQIDVALGVDLVEFKE